MPSRKELVAHGRTVEEITTEIRADLMVYQTLPELISACSSLNPAVGQFDCSVFTGEYVTGGVDQAYLDHIETMRSDNAKFKIKSLAINPDLNMNGCSGPMSGAEASIGLAPSYQALNGSAHEDSMIGLSNSFHSSMSVDEAREAAQQSERKSSQLLDAALPVDIAQE
jgi:amidophosphoribosyltransferase